MDYSPQQIIEIFHLLFLRNLEFNLEKSFYAVKGGCNLRFFFKSIRYSEDLDLDVRITSTGILKKKVDKILGSPFFKQALSVKRTHILSATAAKQTDTTQRWKIRLQTGSSKIPLHTKIEFSRRSFGNSAVFEAVDPEIIRTYKLYPLAAAHYPKDEALVQKINALLFRKETQSRDMFDVHLLAQAGARLPAHTDKIGEKKRLIDLVEKVGFDDFKSQVLAYLMPDQIAFYDSPDVWQKIRMEVIKFLEGLS